MDTVKNTKTIPGEQTLGVLYDSGKVRRRREWRGLKDTLIDYVWWLKTWGVMIDVSLSKGFFKGLFRYRWMYY